MWTAVGSGESEVEGGLEEGAEEQGRRKEKRKRRKNKRGGEVMVCVRVWSVGITRTAT